MGRADELQERLSQLERERESRFQELEARVAASDAAMARAQFEATSMRRVLLFCFDVSIVASLSAFC